MDKILKYSVGIDVSKDNYQCCFSTIDTQQQVKVKASRSFGKTQVEALITWIHKNRKQDVSVSITMEATGVYYEEIAWFLFTEGYAVSVILPNKAKKYLESLGLKSKTDKIDAKGLARMGAEQRLEPWQPFSERLYELRALTRQHQRINEQKTSLSNQLHATKHGRIQIRQVVDQLSESIQLCDRQLKQITEAIEFLVANDPELKERIDNICQIKGLGLISVTTVIAETDGFALIKNQRQLTSYAGYDVKENQSGAHVGKTRISKHGNSRIRRILHMPAFSVVRYRQKPFEPLYNRVYERTRIKMKGYVAVQRKLLVLIYTLWKKNEAYNPDYHQTTSGNHETKSSFCLPPIAANGPIIIKAGRSTDLPAQDGLLSKQSTEALFLSELS